MHLHDTERLVRLAIDGDRHAACELISNLKHHNDLDGARMMAYLLILRGEPFGCVLINNKGYKSPDIAKFVPTDFFGSRAPFGLRTPPEIGEILICGGRVDFHNFSAIKGRSARAKKKLDAVKMFCVEMSYCLFRAPVYRVAANLIVSGRKPMPNEIDRVHEPELVDLLWSGQAGSLNAADIITHRSKLRPYLDPDYLSENNYDARLNLSVRLIQINLFARCLITSDALKFDEIINESVAHTEAQSFILPAIQKTIRSMHVGSFFDLDNTAITPIYRLPAESAIEMHKKLNGISYPHY